MGLFSGLGGFIGGLIGNNQAKGDIKKMRGYYESGLDTMKNANTQAGPSAYSGVTVNPALRAAQSRALGQLQGEAAAGGLGAEDKAAIQQAQNAEAQQERGQREAIQANMAARGQAGGGQEFAGALANQQGSAQRNAMAGTQVAADARKRALAAMAGAGELGGKMEQTEFGEKARAADASDLINRFNAGQRLQQAAGTTSAYQKTADMYGGEAARKKGEAKDIGSGIGGIGDTLLGGFL